MRRLFVLMLVLLLVLIGIPAAAQVEPVPLPDPLALSSSLDATVLDVALSADGRIVYAGLDDGTIAILTPDSNGQLQHIPGSPVALASEGAIPTSLALAPDGSRLYVALAGTGDSTGQALIAVYALDPISGQLLVLGLASVGALDGQIQDLAVSADGTQLLINGFKSGGLAVFPVPAVGQAEPAVDEHLTEAFGPEMANAWINTLYDRVQADAVNAPAASRLYGYAGVTLYEGLVNGMPANRSLVGQLNDFPDLPIPVSGQVFDWPTVAAAALRVVLSGLMSEESGAAFRELADAQVTDRQTALGSASIVDASVGLGDSIGADILAWAQADGYDDTRELTADYEILTGDPSFWVVTTEGRAPVEPLWGSIRPFALGYADECAEPMNAPYSEEEGSTFYQQAMEVLQTEQSLTPEQIAIAQWWIDTPGQTGAPSGHWMKIGEQIIDQLDLNLAQAAEVYGMLGMTLADSFISTWSLKYQINLLRPVTYIQRFIDERWQPYIESPSFPEYPSGHSVTSAAAADMLTSLVGAVAFTDRTNEFRGLVPRSFTSIEAAASEAAISRLYGGIHFRQAIENGMRQGRCISEHILNVVTMRQFGQNE